MSWAARSCSTWALHRTGARPSEGMTPIGSLPAAPLANVRRRVSRECPEGRPHSRDYLHTRLLWSPSHGGNTGSNPVCATHVEEHRFEVRAEQGCCLWVFAARWLLGSASPYGGQSRKDRREARARIPTFRASGDRDDDDTSVRSKHGGEAPSSIQRALAHRVVGAVSRDELLPSDATALAPQRPNRGIVCASLPPRHPRHGATHARDAQYLVSHYAGSSMPRRSSSRPVTISERSRSARS